MMFEQISNGIMSIVVQAILSIVGVLATAVMTVVIQYINKKKEVLVAKMGADNYSHIYNVAKATIFAVEQNFSGLEGAAEQKRKMFDSLLLQKMPRLTQQELDHFREGILGELKYQLKQSQLLATATPKVETPVAPQPNTNQVSSTNAVGFSEQIAQQEILENPIVVEQTNGSATVASSDMTTTINQ